MTDDMRPNNTDEEHPVYDAPGCGLASYSCLLLIIFLIGIIGMISSTLSLFQASFQREPFSLTPGIQVKVWRLQPMRDAKLLDLTEIPILYHDESKNGTTACALTEVAVVRLDRGDGWRIPYTELSDVTTHRDDDIEVAVLHTNSGESMSCLFAPGEGVGRFLRAVRRQL